MIWSNPQRRNPWHLLITPLRIHTPDGTVFIHGKAFGPGDHGALAVVVQSLSHQRGFSVSGTNAGPDLPEQWDAVDHRHLPSLLAKALSHRAQVLLSEPANACVSGPISKRTVRKGLLGSCFWKMSRDALRFFENGSAGKNSLRQRQGKVIQDIQHSARSFSGTQPTLPNSTSAF